MKPEWLCRDLFISSHYYTLCTSEKLFKKALRDFRLPKSKWPEFVLNWHSNATAHYLEHREAKKAAVIVCIRDFEDRDDVEVIGLLAHEAVHIWQQIKRTYGEHTPGDECEAYAIQTLVMNLVAEFSRQTGRMKKGKNK